MRLSLIIPCYNEAANIPYLLERCKHLTIEPDIEVIIVNNGSTDDTSAILIRMLPNYPGCRVVEVKENRGYGYGILSGLRAAEGEVLAWTHADLQTDPRDALIGLDKFSKFGHNIFVKGHRYGRPILDNFFTVAMSIFETLLLGKQMYDINAQPTMFPRSFFISWRLPPDDFSLDLYAYYHAHICSLKIHRFPVKFANRLNGISHWNLNWKAKYRFIRRTVDFSIQLKKKTSS